MREWAAFILGAALVAGRKKAQYHAAGKDIY